MKFKTLVTILSVVALIAGLSCVLAPSQVLSIFGVSLVSMGYVVYQFWGSTLIGIGLLGWFVRGIEDSALQKKIALAFLITTALGTALSIRGKFEGANSVGWSTVILFGVITLGFSSFFLALIRIKKITRTP